jgi:hypothetical protein
VHCTTSRGHRSDGTSATFGFVRPPCTISNTRVVPMGVPLRPTIPARGRTRRSREAWLLTLACGGPPRRCALRARRARPSRRQRPAGPNRVDLLRAWKEPAVRASRDTSRDYPLRDLHGPSHATCHGSRAALRGSQCQSSHAPSRGSPRKQPVHSTTFRPPTMTHVIGSVSTPATTRRHASQREKAAVVPAASSLRIALEAACIRGRHSGVVSRLRQRGGRKEVVHHAPPDRSNRRNGRADWHTESY